MNQPKMLTRTTFFQRWILAVLSISCMVISSPVWPQPGSMSLGSTSTTILPFFRFTQEQLARQGIRTDDGNTSQRLERAFRRYEARIYRQQAKFDLGMRETLRSLKESDIHEENRYHYDFFSSKDLHDGHGHPEKPHSPDSKPSIDPSQTGVRVCQVSDKMFVN